MAVSREIVVDNFFPCLFLCGNVRWEPGLHFIPLLTENGAKTGIIVKK